MLLVSKIKEEFQHYTDGLTKRGIPNATTLLNDVLDLEIKRVAIQQELDEILSELNKISKEIGQLFKTGKKAEAEAAKAKTVDLKDRSKSLGEAQTKVQEALLNQLYQIPNIPHSSVVKGNSEEDNEIVKINDENTPKLGSNKKPHWELIEKYDIIDFELGNKVTGAGFPFYKNQGARLVRALINFFLDEAIKAGYREIQPPIMINESSGYGTGQLPDKEGQMYQMEGSNLFMIPTAEVPITNIYRDVILKEEELPIKNAGHTPCFRREAGSWGAHVRGLNRLHQFDKVEIVQIAHPEKSYQLLDDMVAHVESLIQKLELPYRILRLCGGDLGFTSALTFDFEVYSAAQEKWLEVSSVSNFETYQANRLKLRIKDKNNQKHLAHTLNGSALALPRIMAALIENNQQENTIKMPEVLHSYLGFSEISK